jgi:hypothetical protein
MLIQFADAFALSWFDRASGAAAVAGTHSQSGSQTDGRAGKCRPEGQGPGIRTFHLPTNRHGLGVCGNVPLQREARWSEPTRIRLAPQRIGKSTGRLNWRSSCKSWKRSRETSIGFGGTNDFTCCPPHRMECWRGAIEDRPARVVGHHR